MPKAQEVPDLDQDESSHDEDTGCADGDAVIEAVRSMLEVLLFVSGGRLGERQP